MTSLCDLHAVAGRLLVDLHQHRVLAVGIDLDPLRHVIQADPGHVAQAHHAARARVQHDLAQRLDRLRLVVGQQQIELVVIGDAAHRLDRGGVADRSGDVGQAQVQRTQLVRIDIGMELGHLAALHVDMGHAVDAAQQRAQLVFGQVAQRAGRLGMRAQAVGQHRERGRIHPPGRQLSAGGQLRQRLACRGIDLLQRGGHVRAPVEGHRDVGAAAAGGGTHIAHATHAAHRLFHRRGHLDRHLVGRPVARIQGHLHARERHVREQRHRHQERAGDAADRQHQRQEQQRAPMQLHPRGDAHLADSRTASPSLSS